VDDLGDGRINWKRVNAHTTQHFVNHPQNTTISQTVLSPRLTASIVCHFCRITCDGDQSYETPPRSSVFFRLRKFERLFTNRAHVLENSRIKMFANPCSVLLFYFLLNSLLHSFAISKLICLAERLLPSVKHTYAITSPHAIPLDTHKVAKCSSVGHPPRS